MRINKNKISSTEFLILFWGCLLSVLVERFLSMTTNFAGKGTLLVPLLAFPVLLFVGIISKKLADHHPDASLFSPFGGFLGKIIAFFYLCWAILLLCLRLQLCANRFLSVGYQEGSLYFLLPAVGIFTFWMSGSSLSGFSRTSTLFFGSLVGMLALVVGLSLPEIQVTRLLPLWTEDILPTLWGVVPLLGIFGQGIFVVFFLKDVDWGEKNPWILWKTWSILGCFSLTLLAISAIGTYGTHLIGEMEQPFFQLAKGIRVEGAFQRIESLVASLWTLADFILLGVLIRGSAECGKHCLKEQNTTLLRGCLVLVSTIIALFCGKFQESWSELAIWGNLIFGIFLPCCSFFLLVVKKRLAIS